MKRKKWHEVYPYGTKEGNEEARFFKALSRHHKFDYRSTGAIAQASGLSRERVEEIIDKYVNYSPQIVFPSPSNEDHWAYWERIEDKLDKETRSISEKDRDDRIQRHMDDGRTQVTTQDF